MKKQNRLLLLKLVSNNGNLSPLLKLGLTYSQILDSINLLIEEGLIVKDNNKLNITDRGESEIDTLNSDLGRQNSAKWIEPASENKIPILEKNDIYLPNQNELSF